MKLSEVCLREAANLSRHDKFVLDTARLMRGKGKRVDYLGKVYSPHYQDFIGVRGEVMNISPDYVIDVYAHRTNYRIRVSDLKNLELDLEEIKTQSGSWYILHLQFKEDIHEGD